MAALPTATIGDNTIDDYTGSATGTFVGGNAVNVAVHLHHLGHPARYVGAIGDDAAGRRVTTSLTELGINTEGVITLPGVTSTSQVLIDENGERSFLFEDFATSGDFTPTARDLDRVIGCAAVHVGMLTDASEVRRQLAGSGALLSQDCAVTSGYDHLDVAFCSVGPDLAAAKDRLRTAVGGGARLGVATRGAEGSIAFDGDEWISVPAVKTHVVDTTGAGDSYIAAFLSARLAEATVEQAMRAGARLAAETCGHLGSWPVSLGGR